MTAFAALPTFDVSKKSSTPVSRKGSMREFVRRTMHGGTGWVGGLVHDESYQPQDHDGGTENGLMLVAKLVGGEPDDARITGGTRSLMRRLSGLNVRVECARLVPVVARAA